MSERGPFSDEQLEQMRRLGKSYQRGGPMSTSADALQQGPGLRPGVRVTRFNGGPDGICVQLTIGDLYAQLDAEGLAALTRKLDAAQRPITGPRKRWVCPTHGIVDDVKHESHSSIPYHVGCGLDVEAER